MKYYTYIYYDGDLPIYVGKGCGRRAKKHLRRTDTHPFVQKLAKMKREGREPRIEIHFMPCEDAAKELEVLWIALFGRKDLGLGPLLNGTDGGDGGSNPSPETRQKMSAAKKGSHPCRDFVTEEWKQLHRISVSAGTKEALARPEVKRKMSEWQMKLCTVDGVTIYPSRNALIAALGQGKNGARAPSFRYL